LIKAISSSSRSLSGELLGVTKILYFSSGVSEDQSLLSISPLSFSNLIYEGSSIPFDCNIEAIKSSSES
jgi:hypothetical protein